MLKKFLIPVLAMVLLASAGCSTDSGNNTGDNSQDGLEQVSELTIYSGRSEAFIAPFFTEFEAESGIKLNIRYGDSAELAAQILEEGKNSPADLFLSQDAGALGAVADSNLLIELPTEIIETVPLRFVSPANQWVGITGRARVFAYNPKKVSQLPQSFQDFTNAQYKGKFGIAPTNSSFQAFVTALRNNIGEVQAERWLRGIVANSPRFYEKNSMIVEAIDKGEIDLGLVNHYYIFEVAKALGRDISVKDGFFANGDLGNMINVSGAGVLASSKKQTAATSLISFLLRKDIQEKFVANTKEYSLLDQVAGPTGLPNLDQIGAPTVDLDALKDLKRTQDLLIKVGLL
jgi:iron(III) transport system substrate-binding protein